MRYNLLKQSLKAGVTVCAFALMSACSMLDDQPQQIDEPAQGVQHLSQAPVCTAENEASCYVSYEDPDSTLAQAYAPYAAMAVATNASYVAPVTLTTPATQGGISVKDKMAQKELRRQQEAYLQQQQDLALQPISSADIVCNGSACDQQLFKTEIERVIHTTITEENGTTSAVTITTGAPTIVSGNATQTGTTTLTASAPANATVTANGVATVENTATTGATETTIGANEISAEVSLQDVIAYGEEVHDWAAPQGSTMKTLLGQWGAASGWTVVWKMDRDYNLEAGVVFRGKFTEVAAAFIRSFARATPAPIGTFYKGNRVLVINAQENENAD